MTTPARELRDSIERAAAVGKAVSQAAQQAREGGTAQAAADVRTAEGVRDAGSGSGA